MLTLNLFCNIHRQSSRRLMVRTCNGLDITRDQIPPLPPPVALSKYDSKLMRSTTTTTTADHGSNESVNLCKYHTSPKTASRSTSPIHHRVQNLMDEGIPLASFAASNIQQHQQTSTTSSLIDGSHHNQYQQTGGSLLDHPITPLRRPMKSQSSQTTSSTILSKQSSTSSHHLYRQHSISSMTNYSPAPLHPHQNHQSTTTCDLGSTNPNVIKSTTTVNTIATTSTLADGPGPGLTQSRKSHHSQSHNHHQHAEIRDCGERQMGSSCCHGSRHRWQTCPELHKAIDGVTYIADHTRKEEESTRVSLLFCFCV